MSAALVIEGDQIIQDQSAELKKDALADEADATQTFPTRDNRDAHSETETSRAEEKFHADPRVIQNLAGGVLKEYEDDLKKFQSILTDLTKNQRLLIDTVQQENGRFAEMQELYNLEDMFQTAKLYHSKLVKIKKEMTELYQRSRKLKKRALRLQQLKQKEALQLEQQKEREEERERHLMAKVAVKPRS
ncbi:biogenesis of lysosome-related organelles complex 1 subunit 6-like [Ornithodoros turicata]